MSEATLQPSVEEQLVRLSRLAEELRARVAGLRVKADRHAQPVLQEIEGDLRRMSTTLLAQQSTVEASEGERRNLKALAEIGQVVNSSLDLSTVLNEVMDTIIRLTGAERAFLMLRDDHGTLETLAARNWERTSVDPAEQEISRTLIERVISRGEAVLTTNAQADPRFGGQQNVVAYSLRSILCVPLKLKGVLTGVIYAENRARTGLFSDRERTLLSAFADQAAVAVENARLFASVRKTLDEVSELKTLMEDVFASIASGVITTDIADKITLCNRAAEAILGRPRETMVGSSLHELPEPLATDLPARIEEVKNSDRRFIGLEMHPDIPGRGLRDLTLSISPLKTADQTTRGVALVLDDLTEKRRLEAQRRLFERMVSPAVIDQIDPDRLQLGGQRNVITTLFADIRGFTAFGETMDPEALVEVLNRYLAAAADAILGEDGTIDKFLGDAVMAWFNAPLPQPDHAARAARAALAIRESVARLHAELPAPLRLSYGVGIHSGDALLGFVGTQKRLDYTAIGDSVNTARRLQENARAGQILVSRVTASELGPGFRLGEGASLQVEGRGQPVEVLELIGWV